MAEARSRTVDLGARLSATAFDTLCGPAVDYPPGTTLFAQGENADVLYLIDDGVVKHVRTELCADGRTRSVLVSLRSSGSLLGATAALLGTSHVSTVSTLTRARLRQMSAPILRNAAAADLRVSRLLNEMQAWEFREQILRAGVIALPAEERMLRLLRRFVGLGLTAPWGPQVRLDVPLTHEEMGEMIGVSRETIGRLFAVLEGRGVVTRKLHGAIVLLGPVLLGPRQGGGTDDERDPNHNRL